MSTDTVGTALMYLYRVFPSLRDSLLMEAIPHKLYLVFLNML